MAKANQTFLIPEAIRRLRLSELPLSGELAPALRRLRISTFDDLTGVSLRNFQRVSDRSTALFLEIGRLIQRARQGDLAASPVQHVRLKQASTHSRFPHVPERALRTPTAALTRPINANVVSESPQDETIFIPQEARGKILAAVPVSVRLQHILEFKHFRLFGDLHGCTFSEIGAYRNCGKKTLDELRKLVHTIQHVHHAPAAVGQTDVDGQEARPPVVADAFFVPANLHSLSTFDLPLSVRLEGVLRKKGVRRLGDLHCLPLKELRRVRNCGKNTIAELILLIERATAGEFTEVTWNPTELVRTLDALVADLPDRNEEILLLRLGGKSDEVPSLEEVGAKFGITRERVRQIVDLGVERVRKTGSRRLDGHPPSGRPADNGGKYPGGPRQVARH